MGLTEKITELENLLVELEKKKGSIELHRVIIMLLHSYSKTEAEALANAVIKIVTERINAKGSPIQLLD